ncbi:16S rRNA (adenine(1518)-N(6)/adenine(1519)-N(6))-dimethyltransferase RsmA [Sphingomicrobium flavum]|uniref:16S rRNA (adenine(1518)-N(6)/adenine(1519)-N(6))- dimethyltransferase RsmA n=1 Tax=Sphingomicrobium flavum TaxID=1229164 RepID=UPI0021ADDB6E|nr:16S rRNA (adenine(1518)-N(6)/adenine(1519)-N(6))-dimethyltransferase RsmA [Sphingomicrobium flavum]
MSVEPLRTVIARHGLSASKTLGQNFILDRQLLARIAAIPGNLDGQPVFEVGPGPGGLTRALLDTGAKVAVVERDARCMPVLAELEEEFGERLTIVEGDAMEVDARALVGDGAHIVSNLPYNVGTALFTGWLDGEEWPPFWQSLTLMFQREVAQRIVAEPGGSAYGRLAVLAQWRSVPRIAMKVSRSAFVPPPKVESAVVHVVPKQAPDGVDPKLLAGLTAAAFGQRRKMLRQSLKSLPGALDALRDIGIEETRRAETISVDEFVAMARLLSV